MWIGLCGQSGAGKGYIAALFAEKGVPSIDTDRIYRDLTGPASPKSPCMEALCAAFGPDTANEDGSLNRTYLRSVVFGAENRERLHLLNRITHRFILAETEMRADKLTRDGAEFVLIDAPLLYESGFDKGIRTGTDPYTDFRGNTPGTRGLRDLQRWKHGSGRTGGQNPCGIAGSFRFHTEIVTVVCQRMRMREGQTGLHHEI